MVHVTAYGTGSEWCKVAHWGPVIFAQQSAQQVKVLCFAAGGTPVDARFTMTYDHPSVAPYPTMAFLLADQPSPAFNTPYTPNSSFNSNGGTNTVERAGVGVYLAKLPNLGDSVGGHVQVTAYGTGSERCKVGYWTLIRGAIQVVEVQCFTSNGALADSRFAMTYVLNCGLIGNQGEAAYLWAEQPTSASYTPNEVYQFNTNPFKVDPIGTITRSGVGVYSVQFLAPELVQGNVQVTAHGLGPEYCKVAYWNYLAGVQVRCFQGGMDNNGVHKPVDTQFDVTFHNWVVMGKRAALSAVALSPRGVQGVRVSESSSWPYEAVNAAIACVSARPAERPRQLAALPAPALRGCQPIAEES
jgi:hypothetical protein